MSASFGVTERGLQLVLREMTKERDEADARAKLAATQASKAAGAVLRQAAGVRRGFVRTSLQDSSSGAGVSAVANVPISGARVNAAVQAGSRVFGGES